MNINLLGTWKGTATTGYEFSINLSNARGETIREPYGGPPHTYAHAGLKIMWQGDYQTFYRALVVSPFYGELTGLGDFSVPLSGFINTEGFIKFSFYIDSPSPRPGVQ